MSRLTSSYAEIQHTVTNPFEYQNVGDDDNYN